MAGMMTCQATPEPENSSPGVAKALAKLKTLGVKKPALGYWDIRGLAQQIRFLLTYLKIDFDDVVYKQGDWPSFSNDEWADEKFNLDLDFPNLPYYFDGDVRLTEALAILKYISVKHQPSLLGKTPEDQGMVEMLAHVISEVTKQSGVPCYVGTQTKAEIGDDMLLKIKPIVAHLELQRSKFLVGDYLTYVDFMLFELCERVHFLTDGRLYEEAPLLQKHN